MTIIFSKTMKKAQNISNTMILNNTSTAENTQDLLNQSRSSKKEKSLPKFNRTTDSKALMRKKSQAILQPAQKICYISPRKSFMDSSNFFKSIKFQDVAHNFTGSIFEQAPTSRSEFQNSNSQIFSGATTLREQTILENTEREAEIDFLRSELQEMKIRIEQSKKQNKKLYKKNKELEQTRDYLMERENYIIQLRQANSKISQELSQKTLIISQTQKQIEWLKQIHTITLEQMKKDIEKLSLLSSSQQSEINQMVKVNLKLKCQLKAYKGEKMVSTQNIFSKKFKENMINNQKVKKRNLFKSKSMLCNSNNNKKETKLEQSNTAEPEQNKSTNSQQQISQEISEKVSAMSKSATTNNFYESSFFLNSTTIDQSTKDYQNCDCYILIKKLKQKIRYCQIQIDILKKLKLDSQKLKQDNNKLKILNRKYLHKIQSFTRQFSKRNRPHSNSSLELSLSPKKFHE